MRTPPKSLSLTHVCALFLVFLCLMHTSVARAATHWVSPTGAAAWSSCVGSSPLSGSAACSLAAANSNAAAGDLVYLRAGTYSTVLQPSHSGSAGTPPTMITFQGYTGETATISTGGDGFDLIGVSYISIKNITFLNPNVFRIQQGANHNEIAFNTIQSSTGGPGTLWINANGGGWATHNWIHDNAFNVSGQAHGTNGTGCTDGGFDVIEIGQENTSSQDNNNTVENNVFSHAPHASIDQYGLYNVYRNNVFHNEPWSAGCSSYTFSPTYSSSNPNDTAYNGKFAHRDWQVTADQNQTKSYLLIEGNRVGYAGVNDTNDGADNLSLAAPGNILRYNYFYASMSQGLMFKYGWNYGGGTNGGTYNRVYNNTFYQNGWGYPFGYSTATCTAGVSQSCPFAGGNITTYAGSVSAVGNVLKNNLLYQSNSFRMYSTDVVDKNPGNAWSEFTGCVGACVSNNWCTGSQTSSGGCSAFGDPKFTNPDISNPASTTLPDLSLQSSSTAIDGGAWLTTATNAGTNATTLTVADSWYFQDGTWGSDLAKSSTGLGGTMQADWIALGTVSNAVQIASVTYGTYNAPAGTIALASPMTWTNGAHIWLYKKSDGTQVLYGSAPDYGASEYKGAGGTGGALAAPTNLQAIVN